MIAMYHRIISPQSTDDYLEPGMYVTPETFSMHCNLFKRYFHVVQLSDIIIQKVEADKKPLCAITFDDGWLDFYTNAFPVLLKNSLPSTVFLPTDYIGSEEHFWTDHLATILKKVYTQATRFENCKFEPLIEQILSCRGNLVTRIDTSINLLKPYPTIQIKKIIDELAKIVQGSSGLKRAFLSWDEVKLLKTSGLVTFGSHTAGHRILTSESEDIIIKELNSSRERLLSEHAVDHELIPFCYPNGGVTQAISKIVKNTGYYCALTTKRGWNNRECDRYTLRRIGMHQDMSSTEALTLARFGS